VKAEATGLDVKRESTRQRWTNWELQFRNRKRRLYALMIPRKADKKESYLDQEAREDTYLPSL
jgi:hypothetical protein